MCFNMLQGTIGPGEDNLDSAIETGPFRVDLSWVVIFHGSVGLPEAMIWMIFIYFYLIIWWKQGLFDGRQRI